MNQRTRAVDIRRGILAAFVAAVALSLFAVPRGAGADSGTTEALRSRAADVMADIDRLDARRAAAVAAEQRAHDRLTAARHTLAETELRISTAENTVHVAEQRLADTLVAAYKRSDDGSTTGYLLGAASFSDLINRVDVIDRISNSEAGVIAQVQAARKRLDDDRRQQQQAVDAANQAVADAAAARRQRRAADRGAQADAGRGLQLDPHEHRPRGAAAHAPGDHHALGRLERCPAGRRRLLR